MDQQRFRDIVLARRHTPQATLACWMLRIASLPYAALMRGRNLAYDRSWRKSLRVPVPVVSVGNLTVGGTGKTPVVETVARWYRQHGLRVAILSRGYGTKDGPNDEALVLEENLPDVPHLQGTDRVALAKTAIEELESEILILDDGFQHRRLARNLDIVLIDATCPFGGNWALPGGLLREPIAGIRRASLIGLTRTNHSTREVIEAIRTRIRQYAAAIPIVHIDIKPTSPQPFDELTPVASAIHPSSLSGRRIFAFCGIGNPESFRQSLEDLGALLVGFRVFPDHFPYSADDILRLEDLVRDASPDFVLTTQKDWVKLRLDELADRPLVALRVAAVVTTESDKFDAVLESQLPAKHKAAS